jgi:UDP-N-acetylmuramoyl-tripeptide--D-alanyl-D-alanine ligase
MAMGECANLCGGRLLRGDPSEQVTGISTDSRAVREGELFLALKGERFDGHDFAETAVKEGAIGIIGEARKLAELQERLNQHAGLIEVGDTLVALHSLARSYRSKFDIPLVAITGSCGKTTTKDMLAAILSQTRKTVKTEGNLNNLIGAPLMLFRIDAGTQAAVIEIASNAPGEIERLARILGPTAGIITNVAPVHLEGLGTIEGVLMEKCSLLPHISSDGFLVINEESISPERVRPDFGGKIITFGLERPADFFASNIVQDIEAGTEFLLNDKERLRIPVPGTHNVLNALAAIAAALELDAGMDAIRRGLDTFSASAMRMQVSVCRGATIINDAYNANPLAMRESISTLMAMPGKRKILALGDMLELGESARDEHRALGRYIGRSRPGLLYLKGEFGADVRDGALEGGMQSERIHLCEDAAEIAASLKYILRPGDLLLVKGSRGTRMEQVIEGLSEGI